MQRIDIWTWVLDLPDHLVDEHVRHLGDGELMRRAAFVFDRDRQRFTVARGRLRMILGDELGVPPAALAFTVNAFGKPSVVLPHRPAPHFNLSHSGEIAVLAVSQTLEVGVDVEIVRPLEESLASLIFSPAEQQSLARLEASQRERAIVLGWTRKEAFVKASGQGLSMPLSSFDVSLDPAEDARFTRIDAAHGGLERWRLIHLDLADGKAVGAIAHAGGGQVALRLRRTEVAVVVGQPFPDC
ncbi:4'-phosphopantetheinyl transferase family protein [Consotaella salsifontis]|uniref:4'-phosphopantetheinyl transferase n=1 Tax=Consotaella salsifontis TaxID=1365950 RepID=A0A1T4SXF6_9HYPH|nr:4'-phosphopantetheinyl transferase superfamily protein [Consotaella salsifontis]SKA32934.1 4'-phosphopantetheinyl transferase [Consotaella salsifontis]